MSSNRAQKPRKLSEVEKDRRQRFIWYIQANSGLASATLAEDLNLTVGSVTAVKANYTRKVMKANN